MEQVKNRQVKDDIAAILRREILSGNMEDGEELAQETVAEKLGVSRIPVREAFQALQNEGFLLRMNNRHVQVVGINEESVRENMRVIAAVEIEIARIAAEGNRELTVLQELLRQYEQAMEKEQDHECAELEYRFHKAISSLTENYYLSRMHESLLSGYPRHIWDHVKLDRNARHLMLKNMVIMMRYADKERIAKECRQCYDTLGEHFLHTMKEKETADDE